MLKEASVSTFSGKIQILAVPHLFLFDEKHAKLFDETIGIYVHTILTGKNL